MTHVIIIIANSYSLIFQFFFSCSTQNDFVLIHFSINVNKSKFQDIIS